MNDDKDYGEELVGASDQVPAQPVAPPSEEAPEPPAAQPSPEQQPPDQPLPDQGDAASPAEADSKQEEPEQRSTKSALTNVLIIGAFLLVFFVGLVVLFYPSISNYVNQKNSSRVVQTYREEVQMIDPAFYEAKLQAAHDYNARLAESGSSIVDAFSFAGAHREEQVGEYWELLRVSDRSKIIGYVVIDILGIEVPLYHGTGEIALAVGAGHIQGTSLPVGGESTHTAVSAHTGQPSAKFFDGVDRLKEGDSFQLHVLNEILTYQVDQILIVLPDELDALTIEQGIDYATLVTCTPYGINTHRLLVRGHRIPTPPEDYEKQTEDSNAEERQGLFAKIGNTIVVGLANIVEAIASGIKYAAERVMDLFGVKY